MKKSIELKNLCVDLNGKKILDNICLDVYEKKPVCIIGEGETGKTTLLKTIIGLVPIKSGEILINNISLKNVEYREKVLESFGVVFQKDALFDSLNVWQNIMFKKLNINDEKNNYEKAVELLNKVNLGKDVADLFPSELSGGMRKRVAIARAVSDNPRFLILDEPTAGLDPSKTNTILRIILELSEKLNATILAVTSDMNGALKYFDQIILLKNTRINWCGKPSQVQNDKNSYLKKFFRKAFIS